MTSFNLRTAKLRPGEVFEDTIDTELTPLEYGGQRYVAVPDHVPAELRITRATTGSVYELRFRARLHGPCYRCLTDAVVDQSVSAREYQARDAHGSEELRTPYVSDDRLELSSWARDALALALPEKILCRPDCAGLCPVCGEDLNANPHAHEEQVTDSRWAALEQLRERL